VGVVGVVHAGPVAGHRLACDALACSGSAAAQGLRVVRLVLVRSVSRCPLAWPQRPAAGAVDAQAPLGVGSPGGAGGCRGGGVAHQLTPCRAGVSTRGNCSDRLRLLVGPVGARCGHVCSAVGVVHAGAIAAHRLACAQAAPLHRACRWRGWCWCGRWHVARWRGHSAPPLVRLTHRRRSGWAHQVGPVAVEVVQWLRSSRPPGMRGTRENPSRRFLQRAGPSGVRCGRAQWWGWCRCGRWLRQGRRDRTSEASPSGPGRWLACWPGEGEGGRSFLYM